MNYTELTIKKLYEICSDCGLDNNNCKKSMCNVGYALELVEKIREVGKYRVEEGIKLIPTEDAKYHDEDLVAQGIANICKLCKECNENHTELCPISIARRSLELIILNDSLDYPGNSLLYFVEVSALNKTFADKIIFEYREIR